LASGIDELFEKKKTFQKLVFAQKSKIERMTEAVQNRAAALTRSFLFLR
jgi:hypothetical protein